MFKFSLGKRRKTMDAIGNICLTAGHKRQLFMKLSVTYKMCAIVQTLSTKHVVAI